MTRLPGAAALILGNPSDADQQTFDTMAQHHHGSPEPFQAAPAWQARHGGINTLIAMTARAIVDAANACPHKTGAGADAMLAAIWAEQRAAAKRDKADEARRAGL